MPGQPENTLNGTPPRRLRAPAAALIAAAALTGGTALATPASAAPAEPQAQGTQVHFGIKNTTRWNFAQESTDITGGAGGWVKTPASELSSGGSTVFTADFGSGDGGFSVTYSLRDWEGRRVAVKVEYSHATGKTRCTPSFVGLDNIFFCNVRRGAKQETVVTLS